MVRRQFSVLVADESSRCRQVFREALEPQGYGVLTADSGREAIRIVRRETIHVVVMDLRLPDYSGLEIYHTIKDIRDVFLPCIFTTLRMSAASLCDALSEEAVTLLPKPVDERRLLHAIDWSVGKYYADDPARPTGDSGPSAGRV